MKDWGMIVKQSDMLKGSNIAYKKDGQIIVSPAVAILIKEADYKQLELIVKNLSVIDLDNYIFPEKIKAI